MNRRVSRAVMEMNDSFKKDERLSSERARLQPPSQPLPATAEFKILTARPITLLTTLSGLVSDCLACTRASLFLALDLPAQTLNFELDALQTSPACRLLTNAPDAAGPAQPPTGHLGSLHCARILSLELKWHDVSTPAGHARDRRCSDAEKSMQSDYVPRASAACRHRQVSAK